MSSEGSSLSSVDLTVAKAIEKLRLEPSSASSRTDLVRRFLTRDSDMSFVRQNFASPK
jgi:hypothetical protein